MNDTSLFPKSCDMKRQNPEIAITEDVLEGIKLQARVTPSFGLNVYNYTRRKQYSLERNEFLKCHWLEFKEKYTDRVVQPFQLIDASHYHFYKGQVEYKPSLSITRAKLSHPLTLKAGPGVDQFGQRLIPHELFPRTSDAPKTLKKGVKVDKLAAKAKNIDGKNYKTVRLGATLKEPARAKVDTN